MSYDKDVLLETADDAELEVESIPPVDEPPVDPLELSPVECSGKVVGDGVPKPAVSSWRGPHASNPVRTMYRSEDMAPKASADSLLRQAQRVSSSPRQPGE